MFACGSTIGLFLVSIFLLNISKYTRSTYFLVAVFLVLTFMLVGEFLEELKLANTYPFITSIGFPLDLLIWPFAILYLDGLNGVKVVKRQKVYYIFLPFTTVLFVQLVLLGIGKGDMFFMGNPVLLILVVFKLIASLFLVRYVLMVLKKKLMDISQGKERLFLKNAQRMFSTVGLIVAFIYLLFFNAYFDFLKMPDSDHIGSLLISGFLYLFGYVVFTNPTILYVLNKDTKSSRTISISSKGSNIIVELDHIAWIVSQSNYLILHGEFGDYKVRSTFQEMEKNLDNRFLRVHRSYVINRDFVRDFKHWRSGEYLITMNDGKNLTSSRSFKSSIDILKQGNLVTHKR